MNQTSYTLAQSIMAPNEQGAEEITTAWSRFTKRYPTAANFPADWKPLFVEAYKMLWGALRLHATVNTDAFAKDHGLTEEMAFHLFTTIGYGIIHKAITV